MRNKFTFALIEFALGHFYLNKRSKIFIAIIESVNLRQNDNITAKQETCLLLVSNLVHWFISKKFTPFAEKGGMTRIGHFTVVWL